MFHDYFTLISMIEISACWNSSIIFIKDNCEGSRNDIVSDIVGDARADAIFATLKNPSLAPFLLALRISQIKTAPVCLEHPGHSYVN